MMSDLDKNFKYDTLPSLKHNLLKYDRTWCGIVPVVNLFLQDMMRFCNTVPYIAYQKIVVEGRLNA